MNADQWRMRLFPVERRPAYVQELLADFAAAERSDAIHLEALAESERLRKEQAEELADYKAYYVVTKDIDYVDFYAGKIIERIEARKVNAGVARE